MTETYTMSIPGGFLDFMSGSSLMQQSAEWHGYGISGEATAAAIHAAPRIRAGSGYRKVVALTADGWAILADYADVGAIENPTSEGRACRITCARIARLLAEEAGWRTSAADPQCWTPPA